MSHKTNPTIEQAAALSWRRDGSGWILLAGRRRFGRVVPDLEHAGMWRSVKTFGRLSDLANLSWSKNAVLVAAERELEFEARSSVAGSHATDPRFTGDSDGVFSGTSSVVRSNRPAGLGHPPARKAAS